MTMEHFKNKKILLPFLETMATQVCNLSCPGCSNYSDIAHIGYVPWNDIKSQLSEWLEILTIPDFGIIGGEPLVNPEIEQWLVGIRDLMPDSQIRFTTNGLLLRKFPNLLDLFNDIGNCVFKITVHVSDQFLESYISEIESLPEWKSVVEFGILRLKNHRNVRLQINRPTHFIKTYQHTYATMLPYDSDPREAFDNCVQQTCPLLHRGKIYKCSTAGLLQETLQQFGYPNYERWQKFLDPGISVFSDLGIIQAFVENFSKPHQQCGQCPTSKVRKLNHVVSLDYKKVRLPNKHNL